MVTKKYTNIGKVKPKIPKLKWRTKKKFRDCGIFTMLHELNDHAEKMLELEKEFDKLASPEKMSIIVEVVKNREERERI